MRKKSAATNNKRFKADRDANIIKDKLLLFIVGMNFKIAYINNLSAIK